MPTAQQLISISTSLTAAAESIEAIVNTKPLPYDSKTTKLSETGAQISAKANAIGQAGLAALAQDVRGAITQLNTQVNAANTTLKNITDVSKALDVASVILTGAASIATSVATGNWIGAAGDIYTLANNLETAIKPKNPTAKPDGT